MSMRYYIWVQILSLIVALLYFKEIRRFGLHVMMPLLFLVCCVEITAVNCKAFGLYTNIPIYNVYVLLSPFLYYYLFLNLIKFKPGYKTFYLSTAILLLVFFICDYFFIKPGEFNYYTMIASLISYVVLSFIVLGQIVTDESKDVKLLNEPHFWIAGSIIVYSMVSIVITGLHSYTVEHKIQIAGKNIHVVIMPIVNVVLYGGFAYAFYMCKRSISKPANEQF